MHNNIVCAPTTHRNLAPTKESNFNQQAKEHHQELKTLSGLFDVPIPKNSTYHWLNSINIKHTCMSHGTFKTSFKTTNGRLKQIGQVSSSCFMEFQRQLKLEQKDIEM
jgi:hypothetical protein